MNSAIQSRPIVILGPTTVGKTEVAFGLARRLGAEVVDADKFYLYDAMPAVTGQSDAHPYPDVTSHLYGRLNLGDQQWNGHRYASEVNACVRGVRERNRPVVVEGCSNGFVRAAVNALDSMAELPGSEPLLVGLRWKSVSNLPADCERRATNMMGQGMVAEYSRALRQGCGETYAVRKCFDRGPLVAHLCGGIGWARCRNPVAEQWEHHARRHYTQLSRIPHVVWIDHDRRHPDFTIDRILSLQGAQAVREEINN